MRKPSQEGYELFKVDLNCLRNISKSYADLGAIGSESSFYFFYAKKISDIYFCREE
jgi:hypothetical protein